MGGGAEVGIDGRVDKWVEGCRDGHMEEQMSGGADEMGIDSWMEGWMGKVD